MARPKCEISFDHNNINKVFYAGKQISGRVDLTLNKELIVRGVYLRLNGKAETSWTEGVGQTRQIYSASEHYLSFTQYLIGYVGSLTPIPLRGLHTLVFCFELPNRLPTSFEGAYGYIRYTVDVTFDLPSLQPIIFSVPFTVIKELNLNNLLALQKPYEYEDDHKFSWCCFPCIKSSPFKCKIRLPVTCYTPGEKIKFIIDTDNRSDKEVCDVEVGLYKIVKYHSEQDGGKIKVDAIKLTNALLGNSKIGAKDTFKGNLIVPSVPPTETVSSNICHIEYELRVRGVTKICYNNPTSITPITIGTIPFRRVQSLNGMDDSGPPSYQQALCGGNTQIQGNKFRPKYPCYVNKCNVPIAPQMMAADGSPSTQPYPYVAT